MYKSGFTYQCECEPILLVLIMDNHHAGQGVPEFPVRSSKSNHGFSEFSQGFVTKCRLVSPKLVSLDSSKLLHFTH